MHSPAKDALATEDFLSKWVCRILTLGLKYIRCHTINKTEDLNLALEKDENFSMFSDSINLDFSALKICMHL